MQSGLRRLKIWGEFAYCDLGGASCELSFGKSFKSFDFGIISFYEKITILIINLVFLIKN